MRPSSFPEPPPRRDFANRRVSPSQFRSEKGGGGRIGKGRGSRAEAAACAERVSTLGSGADSAGSGSRRPRMGILKLNEAVKKGLVIQQQYDEKAGLATLFSFQGTAVEMVAQSVSFWFLVLLHLSLWLTRMYHCKLPDDESWKKEGWVHPLADDGCGKGQTFREMLASFPLGIGGDASFAAWLCILLVLCQHAFPLITMHLTFHQISRPCQASRRSWSCSTTATVLAATMQCTASALRYRANCTTWYANGGPRRGCAGAVAARLLPCRAF